MLRTSFFSETPIIKQKHKPQTGRKYLKYIYNEKRLVSKSYKEHWQNITIIIITLPPSLSFKQPDFLNGQKIGGGEPVYKRVYINDN